MFLHEDFGKTLLPQNGGILGGKSDSTLIGVYFSRCADGQR
jgi:hypothetical protein